MKLSRFFLIAALAFTGVGIVSWRNHQFVTAEFARPLQGTTFALSRPLKVSAEPGFRSLVKVVGQRGFDCHLLSQARGDYWLHAALIDSDRQLQWRAAAEELWPLRVGNRTHAEFRQGGKLWSVVYTVDDYRSFTARVGPFDAFKIVGTLTADSKLVYTTTLWWSPALRYTLSYSLMRTDNAGDVAWEIAEIVARAT